MKRVERRVNGGLHVRSVARHFIIFITSEDISTIHVSIVTVFRMRMFHMKGVMKR